MAEINYVFIKGGVYTPTDEDTVTDMLRKSKFTTDGPSSITIKGFRKGIVDIRKLNLEELARLCESIGYQLTIQIAHSDQ